MGGQLKMDDEMAAEGWSRLQMLSDTVTDEELLNLEPKVLMNRLYLDESAHHGVRSFDERPIKFGCRCSRIKVADMLKMLGEEEVNSILQEKDAVETNCDFCGRKNHNWFQQHLFLEEYCSLPLHQAFSAYQQL